MVMRSAAEPDARARKRMCGSRLPKASSNSGAACLAVTPTRYSSVVYVRYASTPGDLHGLPNPAVGFRSSPLPSSSLYAVFNLEEKFLRWDSAAYRFEHLASGEQPRRSGGSTPVQAISCTSFVSLPCESRKLNQSIT